MGIHRLTDSPGWIASAKGPAHALNEDAAGSFVTASGLRGYALADGAGSASKGREAAKIALDTFLEWGQSARSEVSARALTLLFHDVVSQILEAVINTDTECADWRCTFVVAVVDADGTGRCASVGDSRFILGDAHGNWASPVEIDRGEYENETRFLIDAPFTTERNAPFTCASGDTLVLLSDGLDPVAWDKRADRPFAPFFNSLRTALSGAENPAADLDELLHSPRLQERVHDDCTLVWDTL